MLHPSVDGFPQIFRYYFTFSDIFRYWLNFRRFSSHFLSLTLVSHRNSCNDNISTPINLLQPTFSFPIRIKGKCPASSKSEILNFSPSKTLVLCWLNFQCWCFWIKDSVERGSRGELKILSSAADLNEPKHWNPSLQQVADFEEMWNSVPSTPLFSVVQFSGAIII